MSVSSVGSRSSFNPASEPMLREGARGAPVVTLQNALRSAGFNPGASDGAFGPGTLAAVTAFQRSRGLSADGVVGPNTWGALARGAAPSPSAPAPASGNEPTVSIGSRGAAVATLQQSLARAGFNPGCVDGA